MQTRALTLMLFGALIACGGSAPKRIETPSHGSAPPSSRDVVVTSDAGSESEHYDSDDADSDDADSDEEMSSPPATQRLESVVEVGGSGRRRVRILSPMNISDYTDLRKIDTDIDNAFAMGSVDCASASDLKDAICVLADRVCDNVSTRTDQRRCDDGKLRCERAANRLEDRCG